MLFYAPEAETLKVATQNILVLDDKRDESKPSQPSGHSSNVNNSSETAKVVPEKQKEAAQPVNQSDVVRRPSQGPQMIQLNSSGETVRTSNESQNASELPKMSPSRPNTVALFDQLVARNRTKPAHNSPQTHHEQPQPSKEQLIKMNKRADEIAFEILADTVARDIAFVLKTTIDRNKN